MLTVSSILAFNDNYIWLIENGSEHCAVVDPGQSEQVITILQKKGLILDAILLTHHHQDHINGVKELLNHFPNSIVYTPDSDRFIHATHKLKDDQTFSLLNEDFRVLKITGHTKDHIAFYTNGMVFCGDTLFSAGCGRLFEGTASEMHTSLNLLASLPDDTLVFSGHEYTLSNLNFALAVEPNNIEIQKALDFAKTQRQANLPTLPSSIGKEKEINPFLRCHTQTVKKAVLKHIANDSPDAVFAALRKWKDNF